MITILNNKLNSLGFSKFKIIAPLISLSADIILIYYATQVLLPMTLSDQMVRTTLSISQGIPPGQVTIGMIELIREMTISSSTLLFCGFFIFNCVIAYNVYKEGKGSITYLKGYTLSTVILSIVEVFTFYFKLNTINFYTIVTMIMYLFVYLGLRHFSKTEEQKT